MSQFSHPTIPVRSQIQAHKAAWIAALLALAATATIALVMTIDGGSSTSSVAEQPQPAVRSDGGPNESSVAASVGSRPSTGPSESRIAASVGGAGAVRPTGGPDESSVAAGISGR
jgi:hypothetical protein